MDSEMYQKAEAAVEAAYIAAGVIPGESWDENQTAAFMAASDIAYRLLPEGQIRWTQEGRLTNGARHVLEQTFQAVKHMLNG